MMKEKINFIELCEKTKSLPIIDRMWSSDSYRKELDLCIKEWREGKFERGMTTIADGLAPQFMDSHDPEEIEFYDNLLEIQFLHELRVRDKVWYKYCY